MSNIIGKFGEVQVINFLDSKGFSMIFVFENASGNGLDVVAMKKYRDKKGKIQRFILSIEVKTTTTSGSGPRLSAAQKNGFLNTGKILVEAATAKGRFKVIGPTLQKAARLLIHEIGAGVPMYPLLVRLQISKNSIISASTVKRVRLHSFTANIKKSIIDTKK